MLVHVLIAGVGTAKGRVVSPLQARFARRDLDSCRNDRCDVVLTRVFSGTTGVCLRFGRVWGHGGTPLSKLRGSWSTGFRLRIDDEADPPTKQ